MSTSTNFAKLVDNDADLHGRDLSPRFRKTVTNETQTPLRLENMTRVRLAQQESTRFKDVRQHG